MDLGYALLTKETPRAVLVKFLDDLAPDAELWIPRKCLAQGTTIFRLGERGKVCVPLFWYQKRQDQKKTKFSCEWTPPKLPRSPRFPTQ